MVNSFLTFGDLAPGDSQPRPRLRDSRAVDVTATILSFGTNKLVNRCASWLTRNGLMKYVLPVLLVNEGFGAYRAYVAGGMIGWW